MTIPPAATPAQLQSLSDTLLNTSHTTPLHLRFRSLFTLKSLGSPQAIQIISSGFQDRSELLKHELAYCLGQMGDLRAVGVLEGVLKDEENKHGEMVRHEAAEALGALSSLSSIPLLKSYFNDPARPVRETCEIAVAKIEWDHHSEEGKGRGKDPNFPTIDPAPASSSSSTPSASMTNTTSIPTLRTQLLSPSLPLFERYRAMFALRNLVVQAEGMGQRGRAKEGVDVLAEGFDDESALFRHEIAYIFGQLSSPFSIPSLLRVMRSQTEDDMVRHEAAEALGGIASDSIDPSLSISLASEGNPLQSVDLFNGNEQDREKGVLGILKEWAKKEEAPMVVRESCQVAVDMWEYENSGEFQYASGLGGVEGQDQGQGQGQEEASGEAKKMAGPRLTGMDRGTAVLV